MKNQPTFLIISSSWLNRLDQVELKEILGDGSYIFVKDPKVKAESVIQKLVNSKSLNVIFTKSIGAKFYDGFMSKARNKKVYDQIFSDYSIDKLVDKLKKEAEDEIDELAKKKMEVFNV